MALACFLWWMSHKERVWTLCWVFERSPSFFSKVAEEKEVIFNWFQLYKPKRLHEFRSKKLGTKCYDWLSLPEPRTGICLIRMYNARRIPLQMISVIESFTIARSSERKPRNQCQQNDRNGRQKKNKTKTWKISGSSISGRVAWSY